MAAQDFLFSYLQAGETSISNLLLHHYREIGMTSGELLVYLELKSYIDRGIENPSITWIAENLQTDERIVYEQIHQMTEHQLLVQRMKRDEEGKETASIGWLVAMGRSSRSRRRLKKLRHVKSCLKRLKVSLAAR